MIYLRAAIIILILFGQTAIVQAADDTTHAIETAKTDLQLSVNKPWA